LWTLVLFKWFFKRQNIWVLITHYRL
jgi:hypothetical protein